MAEAMTRIWMRAQRIARSGVSMAASESCLPSSWRHSHQNPDRTAWTAFVEYAKQG
jgi:hypothetical protein